MKKKYQHLSFLLSDASLSLLPEYQQRVQVSSNPYLHSSGFIPFFFFF